MATTNLKKITLESFKGISENSPVIIDFLGQDKNLVLIKGDEGRSKTSTLDGILWMMGSSLGVGIKELYHNGEPIKGEVSFEHKGVDYKVIANGDKIVVKTLREGSSKDKWVNEASPKDLLKTIFKTCSVGQSFRYEKSEKQVEWINELFPLPKEVKTVINEFSGDIKRMKDVERPRIGNEAKAAEAILKANPLYAEYQEKGEALEKEIKKLKKEETNAENFGKISEDYAMFKNGQQKLNDLKVKQSEQESGIKEIENQIKELEIKLNLKKSELATTNESITKGEKYIDDNKKIVEKYEKAKKAQEEQSDIAVRVNNFYKMMETLKVYNEKSEEYTNIDSQIKDIISQIKSIKADYIPEIEGIEVIHEQEMEDGKVIREVGIYYHGVCIRTVSGSEYLTALIKIIRASGSRYVFIDDLATYGTDTIEYINQLATEIKEEGGVIFASEMERGSELNIILSDNIK